MKGSRSLQDWISLAGHRGFGTGALIVGMVLFSAVYAFKQFRGPGTETVCARLEVGRCFAEGQGLGTRVVTPQLQTLALENHWTVPPDGVLPSLSEPPLYPMVVGVALKIAGGDPSEVPAPPEGMRRDYVVLGVNLLFLGLAVWQTHDLGRRWFGAEAARWASLGVLLSPLVWQSALALDGLLLTLVLVLLWARVLDSYLASPGRRRAAAVGGVAAALAVSHYAALSFLALSLTASATGGPRSSRLRNSLSLLAAFAALSGGWWYRNFHYSGNVLGTAWQSVSAKAGDPTALPEEPAARFLAAGHSFDLAKWSNKVSTELRLDLIQHHWSGAIVFAALFAVGWLYRFRDPRAARLRLWLTLAGGAWLLSHAALGAGDDEGGAVGVLVPFVCLFGAAFLQVLLQSLDYDRTRRVLALSVLFALQLFPMARGLAEPRRIHFSYPPYYPKLFLTVRDAVHTPGLKGWSWMSDVPAGAAWYSGSRVWLLPSSPDALREVQLKEPIAALVLTPHFFSPSPSHPLHGDKAWQPLRQALSAGAVPDGWPLNQVERLAPDLVVLGNPRAARGQGAP